MKRSVLGTALFIMLCTFGSAWATPVITSIVRGVFAGDNFIGGVSGPNSANTATGAFSDVLNQQLGTANNPYQAFADQLSNVDAAGSFSGTGHANLDFNGFSDDGPFVQSVTQIGFDLLTPHLFTADGNAAAFMDGGFGIAGYQLLGSGGPQGQFAVGSQNLAIHDSLLLGAGSYQLVFGSAISANSSGGFMGGNTAYDLGFTLSASAVPEPGSLALFGLGVCGVVGLRRKVCPTA